MERKKTGHSTGRAPCVVSDRVVYRTLLRGGMELFEEVVRLIGRRSSVSASIQERIWRLVVRYQFMQTDKKTACALRGADASAYRSFRRNVKERILQPVLRRALFAVFPRKVRQLAKDLRLASDQDFFLAGGLNLRDEIELVRMFVERTFRDTHELTSSLRELEFADDRLRHRLDDFLSRDEDFANVTPYDGFGVKTDVIPRRFWWRHRTSTHG